MPTVECAVLCVLPESHRERKDVDEGIDLEHTQEEDTEVLKSLSEEVPEETNVGSEVWYSQSVEHGGRVMM